MEDYLHLTISYWVKLCQTVGGWYKFYIPSPPAGSCPTAWDPTLAGCKVHDLHITRVTRSQAFCRVGHHPNLFHVLSFWGSSGSEYWGSASICAKHSRKPACLAMTDPRLWVPHQVYVLGWFGWFAKYRKWPGRSQGTRCTCRNRWHMLASRQFFGQFPLTSVNAHTW
jgi:hypothetical protein